MAVSPAWQRAAGDWPPDAAGRAHVYELQLAPRQLGVDLLARLEKLAPHGEGNPQPLARVGPLRLVAPPRIFGKGHLRALAAGADGRRAVLLGWGWAERAAALADWFEVLAYLERDRREGTLELRLVECRPARGDLGA